MERSSSIKAKHWEFLTNSKQVADNSALIINEILELSFSYNDNTYFNFQSPVSFYRIRGTEHRVVILEDVQTVAEPQIRKQKKEDTTTWNGCKICELPLFDNKLNLGQLMRCEIINKFLSLSNQIPPQCTTLPFELLKLYHLLDYRSFLEILIDESNFKKFPEIEKFVTLKNINFFNRLKNGQL